MINRSSMREIPHSPVALYEVAHPFGTLIAETILASVHMRARTQAGHTDASDLIKALQNTLRGGGPSTYGESGIKSFIASLNRSLRLCGIPPIEGFSSSSIRIGTQMPRQELWKMFCSRTDHLFR